MARRSGSDGDVTLRATGKSQAEIAALRHLRETYDALSISSGSSISNSTESSRGLLQSPEKHARPRSSRSRVVDTVRSLQQSQPSILNDKQEYVDVSRRVFNQWLTLETLSRAIDADAAAVHREIQCCDFKTSEIVQLPLVDADRVDTQLEPKWQILREVLGEHAFINYLSDLFREIAALRGRCSLYGATLTQFIERVKMDCIGAHTVRDVVSHSAWRTIANAALSSTQPSASPVLLVSHCPVLMQHCSPPPQQSLKDTETTEENVVVVSEILQLLGRLPPARARLVSLCFEQIGDVRRGSGTAPPPGGIRPHKLSALAKHSHADALCSQEERDEILRWLDETVANGDVAITMHTFVGFHVAISDTFVDEDAEFATYLMRVWRFEWAHETQMSAVLANYEARCQQLTNKARKVEVWKKLDHARAALPTKLAALRLQVAEINSLCITNATQYNDVELLHHDTQQSSHPLVGLRELRLTGLCLRGFPAFVAVLPLLEELDLSDNELHEPLPLSVIGGMKTLKRLVLNDNRLNDRSFSTSVSGDASSLSSAWQPLTVLETVELARNELTWIPSVVFSSQNLKRLNLAGNKLRGCGVATETLKLWTHNGFPTLQMIDFRENELTSLPDALFITSRATLEQIYVQDNHISDLPASFASLERIQEAVFSRNDLKTLATCGFTELLARCGTWKELVADHNRIRTFPFQSPTTFLTIHGLVALHLPKNKLRALPSLKNVSFSVCEELDLHGNVLSEIADDFFTAFPALRVCRLHDNALRRVPESLAGCARLHVLELYANRLEFVPASLGLLRELTVLNLRENQLTQIPTEWHAFALYTDHGHHLRPRVLQTLYLQRNPLKNRVLQTLVDGAIGRSTTKTGSGDGNITMRSKAATPFKSSDTQICEMYARKFIDTLKQSLPVQRLATAVHAEEIESDEKGEEEEEDGGEDRSRRRRRWKGRARFVIQHVETQLRTRVENDDRTRDRERLLVSTVVFKKLLQKLLVASTQKELQLMSERFQCGEGGGAGSVDGFAFLCGLETMGLFNALKPINEEDAQQAGGGKGGKGGRAERCESVRKPVDGVASILQYLQVAHEQKLRAATTTRTTTTTTTTTTAEPQPRLRPRSAPGPAASSRRPQSAKALRTQRVRETRCSNPKQARGNQELEVSSTTTRANESEAARQRQRIHVLEQQLLDQQLLRLAEQKAPPKINTASNADVHKPQASSLMVHIKQLNSSTGKNKAELLVIAAAPEMSVKELKEKIAGRLHVDVSRQILIAKNPSCLKEHVRLRDETLLSSYCHVSAQTTRRWHVSLLVSDQLRVDWNRVVRAAEHPLRDTSGSTGSSSRETKVDRVEETERMCSTVGSSPLVASVSDHSVE